MRGNLRIRTVPQGDLAAKAAREAAREARGKARDVGAAARGGGEGPAAPDRAQRLLDAGIDDTLALQLLAGHLPGQIDCALDNAAWLAARGELSNAAGYIVEALRRGYRAIPGRLEAEQAARRRARQEASAATHAARRDAAKRAADVEDAQREHRAREYLAAMSPADRADLKQRTLAQQPTSVQQALAERDPLRSRNLAALMFLHATEPRHSQNQRHSRSENQSARRSARDRAGAGAGAGARAGGAGALTTSA